MPKDANHNDMYSTLSMDPTEVCIVLASTISPAKINPIQLI